MGFRLGIERYIGLPIFGFCRYIGIGRNGRFISLSRCWQNAVIFLTHPENLCARKHNEL